MVKIEKNISFKDLEEAIRRLPVKDRAKLLTRLQQDTWRIEFRKLLSTIRSRAQKHPISQKEITNIVDNVRQRLHDQSGR